MFFDSFGKVGREMFGRCLGRFGNIFGTFVGGFGDVWGKAAEICLRALHLIRNL